MAGRPSSRNIQSRRGPGDPWFTMGTVDVTTSVLVPLITVIVWVAASVSPSVLTAVWLSRASYRTGFVWQLLTWPFASMASLAGAIGLFFFWSFGRILEEPLGPTRYLRFLAICTAIVGLGALLLDLFTRSSALLTENRLENTLFTYLPILAGPRLVSMGVAVCVAAEFPHLRSFFNIPIRLLVGAFLAIEVLQALGTRYWLYLAQLAFAVVVFLTALRSFGLGSELPSWIPRLPLPAKLTGSGARGRPLSSKSSGSRSSGGLGNALKRGGSKRSGSVVAGPWGEQGTGTATPGASAGQRTTAMTRADREEVDRLLDKIAQDGMSSLSSDERARLEDASRRLRESEGR